MSERQASANIGDSLYKRLGGYGAIAAAVADLMPRLRSDPKLWVYWKGKSLESRRRGDRLLVDFLCAAFGGPAFYAAPTRRRHMRAWALPMRNETLRSATSAPRSTHSA
jgi:truncated hemoglobin YjbI